jgi:hypothetical protein
MLGRKLGSFYNYSNVDSAFFIDSVVPVNVAWNKLTIIVGSDIYKIIIILCISNR